MAAEGEDDWFGQLMDSIKAAQIDKVTALLEKDHDLNRFSEDDRLSPLSLACQQGQLEIAKMLLDKGADVNLPGELLILHESKWEKENWKRSFYVIHRLSEKYFSQNPHLYIQKLFIMKLCTCQIL